MQMIYSKEKYFENSMSVHQINTYLKCRKAWKYAYVDKLSKKYDKPYFTKGKLIHTGMEYAMLKKYELNNNGKEDDLSIMIVAGLDKMKEEFDNYCQGLDLDSLNPETRDVESELNLVYDESTEIFVRTLKLFESNKWEILTIEGYPAVELHYAMPMKNGNMFHGFIDLVVKEKETNQIWELDWKFQSILSNEEDEAFNIQNAIYCLALKKAGVDVTGSITFQSLNVASSTPNINKNGTISRAKIRISWDDYAEFCKSNGQDPKDYIEEMEPKLADNKWVKINREYRSDFMIENIWNNVVETVVEEISCNENFPPYIKPLNCKSCAYVPICQGEIRGYEVGFIIDSEFVSKLDIIFGTNDEEV